MQIRDYITKDIIIAINEINKIDVEDLNEYIKKIQNIMDINQVKGYSRNIDMFEDRKLKDIILQELDK